MEENLCSDESKSFVNIGDVEPEFKPDSYLEAVEKIKKIQAEQPSVIWNGANVPLATPPSTTFPPETATIDSGGSW